MKVCAASISPASFRLYADLRRQSADHDVHCGAAAVAVAVGRAELQTVLARAERDRIDEDAVGRPGEGQRRLVVQRNPSLRQRRHPRSPRPRARRATRRVPEWVGSGRWAQALARARYHRCVPGPRACRLPARVARLARPAARRPPASRHTGCAASRPGRCISQSVPPASGIRGKRRWCLRRVGLDSCGPGQSRDQWCRRARHRSLRPGELSPCLLQIVRVRRN